MNAIELRENAIESMHKFHEGVKHNDIAELEQQVMVSISKLPASDRNFMLLAGKMNDVKAVYPVSDQLTTRYSLADLVMAYHLYLQEINSNKDNVALMDRIDQFYQINYLQA